MQAMLIAISTALLLTGPQAGSAQDAPVRAYTVSGALVRPVRNGDIDLAAKEAGELKEFAVQEGAQVVQGQELGRIDDEVERKEKKAAEARLAVARLEAANTVRVEYGKKAAEVAESEVIRARNANLVNPGTVAPAELTRLNLAHQQAVLQTRQSENDLEIAKVSVGVREAEDELADLQIQRRKIVAPIDGTVVKCYVDQHEWVQPGTPLLRIIRLDRVRIEGRVNAAQVSPGEVRVGQRVTVSTGGGPPLEGHVVFVRPEIEPGLKFEVWAEVDNINTNPAQPEQGHWLLLLGQEVDMTIHLGPAGPLRQTAHAPSR